MIDFSDYGDLVTISQIDTDPVLLAGVCGAIRTYCGWHIAPIKENDVVWLDNLGDRVLSLPSLRVSEVTHVQNRKGVELDDFNWSDSGLLSRSAGWPHGYRAVRVTYTHGFGAIPPEIIAVAADMVRDAESVVSGPAPQSVQLDDAVVNFGPSTSFAGARRDIGAAYGHILNRYRL